MPNSVGSSNQGVVFNPFTPQFREDPYPHYAELREFAPVHEHPGGFWMLSRYADVDALLRSGLSVDQRNVAPGVFRDAYAKAGVSEMPRLKGLAMLDLDPPDHTRLRTLVSKAFSPKAIGVLEPIVREEVGAALDLIEDAGGGDLVETLAFPLPFVVMTRMMGMPAVDTRHLRKLTSLLMRSVELTLDPEVMKVVEAADAEIFELISEAVEQRRSNPDDGLLSALIAVEEAGDRLSHDELVAQVTMLFVAGYETTVNLISGGIVALLRNPEQFELLSKNPDLGDNAVEEMLRYDSPTHTSRRITSTPYRVGDFEIPSGAMILANLAGANRDESFWGPDAGEFRIERVDARRHLSFGGGAHYCLGGVLARLEGRLAIGELVRRFPRMKLNGEVISNGLMTLRGPAVVPIEL